MLFIINQLYAFIAIDDRSYSKTYHSDTFSMMVREHDAYVGENLDENTKILGVEEVPGGFDLTFKTSRNNLKYNVYSNEMIIEYKSGSGNMNRMVHVRINLYGGALDDVSIDEINNYEEPETIIRIRLIDVNKQAV